LAFRRGRAVVVIQAVTSVRRLVEIVQKLVLSGERRSQNREKVHFLVSRYWSVAIPAGNFHGMGEHVEQQNIRRLPINRKRPGKQTAEAIGRRLLGVVVYAKCCRIGGKLSLDVLAETSEVGEWKMPDFKMACAYAAAQGWLIVEGDALTLTSAGLAAA
jgi:hypothetical protein